MLLVSSYLVATAVHMVRKGRRFVAGLLVLATVLLGGAFLAIKIVEYLHHFHDGIYPGGVGHFFDEHAEHGVAEFWTLYFLMTGLHAVHVTVGMGLLTTMLWFLVAGKITAHAPQRIEVAAIYWHLIDVIWIFLWPLFYLA